MNVMYVEKYGSGSSIFFGLHGWGGNHTTFAPLIKRLPDTATFYSADLPGYGKTPAPSVWSLQAITEQIVAAIEARNLRRIVLVGNCSGAIMGLFVAQALKDRVERLVLIDPFAFMPLYFKIFVKPGFGKIAYFTTFANPIGRWLANLSLKNRRAESTDLTDSFRQVDHETTWQYLKLMGDLQGIEPFSDLTMAIDILYGERTFKAVKQSAAMYKRQWAQANCVKLGGAGHLPIEEATEQLSSIVFQKPIVSIHNSEYATSNFGRP